MKTIEEIRNEVTKEKYPFTYLQAAHHVLNSYELVSLDSEIAKRYAQQFKPKWTPVSEAMPPFDKLLLLRGVVDWKSTDNVSYFSDEVQNDCEILEYGRSGYLLKNNNDYLVVNCPDPREVCSEYITHWMEIPEEPKQ